VGQGLAWLGMTRRGVAGHGEVRLGKARQGAARPGAVWQGTFKQPIEVWHGAARRDGAWRGKAWHGKVFTSFDETTRCVTMTQSAGRRVSKQSPTFVSSHICASAAKTEVGDFRIR